MIEAVIHPWCWRLWKYIIIILCNSFSFIHLYPSLFIKCDFFLLAGWSKNIRRKSEKQRCVSKVTVSQRAVLLCTEWCKEINHQAEWTLALDWVFIDSPLVKMARISVNFGGERGQIIICYLSETSFDRWKHYFMLLRSDSEGKGCVKYILFSPISSFAVVSLLSMCWIF